MQRSRSVVSNSPVSIPSYALRKLREFLQGFGAGGRETGRRRRRGRVFPQSSRGLNRRAESGNFRALHSHISITRAMLSSGWNFVSSSPGYSTLLSRARSPDHREKGEKDTTGEKGSCVPAKNFPRLRKRGKGDIKLDVARAVKKEGAP